MTILEAAEQAGVALPGSAVRSLWAMQSSLYIGASQNG